MSTKRDSDGEESEDNVRVFNVFRRDERVYDRRRNFYDLYLKKTCHVYRRFTMMRSFMNLQRKNGIE